MSEGRGKKRREPNNGDLASNAPFETILEHLESVIEKLEQGNLSLDESLRVFEEGVRLSRMGSKRLEEAEHRIEMLVSQGNTEPARIPFGESSEVES